MAARIAVASGSGSFRLGRHPFLGPKSISNLTPILLFSPSIRKLDSILLRLPRKTSSSTVCFVVEGDQISEPETESPAEEEERSVGIEKQVSGGGRAEGRMARKKSERLTYLVAAVMSSFGITSMAVLAVYCRFSWQMEGGEIPYSEMFGTFAISSGAAIFIQRIFVATSSEKFKADFFFSFRCMLRGFGFQKCSYILD